MSGIRITQAIDNNQILVNVNTFNYSVNPYPLKCPDPNCSAHLVYVKSHIRRSFNKTLHIPAFFRLEKNFTHDKLCQYGTSGLNTIYASDSSHDISRALAKGNNIFRIHILDEDDISKLSRKAAAMQANPPSDTTDRVYVKRGRKAPYVKNMDSLREIYEYGKAHPNKRNSIKIVTGTSTVTWSDFFYETTQLERLSTYLQKVKIAQVAVIMKVHVARIPMAKFNYRHFIEGSPMRIKGGFNIYPTIQLGNVTPKLFPLSSIVMVLGKFTIPTNRKMIMDPIFEREVRTIVSSEEQVLIL
ncbi:hypothetical protein F9214_22410 [Escherichia coli]|uniref:hypothetical protein n=1 Tax=Enterobacteriaceae TaxID=543 RepID=UPI00034D03E6|nr:hypothetical protein [Escherichia coli]EGY9797705.1 hypothetical protein [Shigella flexneri]AUK08607.1 hypothetical protein CR537_23990 [Escherichia coli]EFB2293136.1 hypothetical protein [Escherichia coli]EFB2552578.1 hypothetical protein [Escherichia coli]EFD0833252.1 hypothetical protein [Escherichia coli]